MVEIPKYRNFNGKRFTLKEKFNSDKYPSLKGLEDACKDLAESWKKLKLINEFRVITHKPTYAKKEYVLIYTH